LYYEAFSISFPGDVPEEYFDTFPEFPDFKDF